MDTAPVAICDLESTVMVTSEGEGKQTTADARSKRQVDGAFSCADSDVGKQAEGKKGGRADVRSPQKWFDVPDQAQIWYVVPLRKGNAPR